MSDNWVTYLNEDEQKVLKEVQDWIFAPPSLLSKAMVLAGKPAELAYRLVPAGLKEKLGSTIYGVLGTLRNTSRTTVQPQILLDKISARLGKDVGTHHDQIFQADIAKLDPLANECIRFNKATAAVEGGAAGAVGLPGLIADVPALYVLAFRTIQEVAICYGFPIEGEVEHAYMMKVLDVGHYLENEQKRVGMEELQGLQDMISSGAPLKDLERVSLAKGLQALARELSVALFRRKAAQTMAVVGSVVGASVNFALVNDIGLTAYYAYRYRFLHEVALRRMKRRAVFKTGELAETSPASLAEAQGPPPQAAHEHQGEESVGGGQEEHLEVAHSDHDPQNGAGQDGSHADEQGG